MARRATAGWLNTVHIRGMNMNRKKIFIFILGACLLMASPPAQAEDGGIQILLNGTYHADEAVGIKDKESWMAIFPSGTRYVARRVHVSVKTVMDPVLDDEKGPFTAKEVVSDPKAVFLLKGLPLGNGGVIEGAAVNTDLLEVGKSMAIKGAAGEVKISAENGPGYRLVARVGKKESVLVSSEGEVDNWPHLIWAGDLNKDGYPDFLMDRSDHSNISIPALYLSKKSGGEVSYEKAAEHLSTGC